MIPSIRQQFNQAFTQEKYAAYLHEMESKYPGALDFRTAETPVFVPAAFRRQMTGAVDAILEIITSEDYFQKSEAAIPQHLRVPGKEEPPQFICFDFGVCLNSNGALEPQLIELQAFPTLFAWHLMVPQIAAKHFELPQGFTPFLSSFTPERYTALLRQIIIGDAAPEEVILLELFPHQQKTRVDFYATEDLLGISVVCLTELVQEGKDLYYVKEGRKTKIKRIYNRVIFDDLQQQSAEVQEKGKLFQQELDVAWVPHPNWFYRISKFSMPFIRHPYVPETHFLSDLKQWPDNLEDYVVKPLFSFAGQGVIIDVTKEALDAIADPQDWIIQRKVQYAPAVVTPDEPAKVEIRLFYFWEPGTPKPVPVNNLARLSKGKMIGVRYNKNREWVGGSFCLFAPGTADEQG